MGKSGSIRLILVLLTTQRTPTCMIGQPVAFRGKKDCRACRTELHYCCSSPAGAPQLSSTIAAAPLNLRHCRSPQPVLLFPPSTRHAQSAHCIRQWLLGADQCPYVVASPELITISLHLQPPPSFSRQEHTRRVHRIRLDLHLRRSLMLLGHQRAIPA
jgi:hypothetical protein